MDTIRLKARAKINLGLDVVRRREDGYHEVRMVMQMLKLYDQIDIEKTETPGIRLTCNLSFLPTDERNIAYKAAKVMMEQFDIKQGVCIRIEKHIPVAAGMAGGSTDCAAVLYGMNKLFDLQLSQKKLREIGVKLGADVPYCIMRGSVLAEGIGEVLTPLPPCPRCYILIAKPPLSASTEKVYARYDALEHVEHPDLDRVIRGLEQSDIREVAAGMGNVLEQVMIPEYPVIGEIKEMMLETGALGAMMSGSGPTVFGIYKTRGAAKEGARKIKSRGLARQVYVTNVHNVRRKP